MSKRLQITLTDNVYDKLSAINEFMPASKSSIICIAIDELYKKLDSIIESNKKEPSR